MWDGNEVWLVTGGGALFAAFPAVYAMAFSGFYLAIMLVLFGLIVRAVSLEFRHRDESWKGLWDFFFFLGSAVPALLLGVAVGNVIRGVPLNEVGDYTGTFLDLLNPFSLLVGLSGLAMFMSHGAAWIARQGRGRARGAGAGKWRGVLQIVYVVLVVVTSIYGISAVTRHADNVLERPVGWLAIIVFLVAVGYARWHMRRPEGSLKAFLGSAVSIVALAAIAGIGNYPDIVPARGTPESTSLTVRRRLVRRHDARRDADHHDHRLPAGARLHDLRLPRLPRQGEGGAGRVLSRAPAGGNGDGAAGCRAARRPFARPGRRCRGVAHSFQ